MLKEIYEQPDAVAETVGDRLAHGKVELGDIGISDDELRELRRIVIVACGTSYHAGLIGRYAIEAWSRVPVEMDVASEFRYRDPVIDERDLVIGISQSGETADTLAAMRLAREKGARVLAITNIMGSQATRDADGVLFTRAGLEIGVAATKTFVAQVAAMYLFALKLAETRGTLEPEVFSTLISELKDMPQQDRGAAGRRSTSRRRAMAEHWRDAGFFLYLGRSAGLGVALEGALKLKEISYVPTDAYAAGEMKHGPIALLDERTPVVCVATDSPVLDKVLSNVSEVRARGAHVLAVATEGNPEVAEHAEEVVYVPRTDWLLQSLLAVIPLQLLAYHIARARGPERGPAAQPRQNRHGRVTVGLDLLEIDRLERALARRPRLAERLFTDAEREYAAARARPAQHLAARFCAKEAVAKALDLPGWSFRDVEVIATGGAPQVLLSGAPPRPRRPGPVDGVDLAHPHRRRRPARWRWRSRGDPARPGSIPLYEAQEMRDVDTWAIEEQGIPGEDLMERAGTGSRAGGRRASRPGRRGRSGSWPARATTAATGTWPRGLLREEGREVEVFEPGRARSSTAPAWWSTACWAPASRASRASRSRARSPRSTSRTRPSSPATCPPGVDASTGEVAAEAVRAQRHGHVPRIEGRPPRRARGATTPARWRWWRSAFRAVRPRPPAAGLISERVLELYPRRTRAGSKFTSGVVVIAGGARGPHRRAHDGRAGGAARGRGLRAGGGARVGRADAGAARCWRR